MLSAYVKRAAILGVLGVLAFTLSELAIAQSLPPRPYALKADFKRLWAPAAQPIDIPVGDVPMSLRFDLPAVPATPDRVRCLRFSARLQSDVPAGWNNYLAIRVNGTPVDVLDAKRRPRILNHGPFFVAGPPHNSRTSYIGPRAGLPNLNVFFMPDTFTIEQSLLTDREEESWYLVDVDDLLGAGPVSLEFINTALTAYWDGKPPERMRMVIEGLELGSVPAEQAEALRSLRRVQRKTTPGASVGSAETVATVTPAGGFYVQFAGATFFVDTSLRINGVGRELICGEETITGAERAVVTRPNSGSVETTVATDVWRLTRRLVFKENRIDVHDEFLNKTPNPIGISVHHSLITADDPSAFRLGGTTEDFRRAASMPENPTVFVAQGVQGLGVVGQDNALRLQMDAELTGNRASFGTDHLGIAPGASYVVRWSLYPSSGDYFDFINRVRRDWGVNFTVPGPFDFVNSRDLSDEKAAAEALRALLPRKNIQIFAITPWFEYYSSADMSREEYKALLRKAMQAIKAAKPDAICLAMVETNLTPVPMSFFGDTLEKGTPYGRPDSTADFGKAPGVYGYPAPEAAAALIDASPWRDSVVRGPDGRPLLDTWYVQNYEGKALNLMVYPRPGNHWHAQMMEKLRFLIEDVGVDGVYIDQFSLAYGERDHYTYDYWDGHTVDLDPVTGAIARQYADLAWVSAPARLEWAQYALQRGKMVVANSMPAVEELQTLPIVRFMETSGYDPMVSGIPDAPACARGLLGSPVGLGYAWGTSVEGAPWAGKPKGGDFLTRTLIAHLRYGMLYYYYGAEVAPGLGGYGALNRMFPFTPVELHEGWVRGQERIITCVSGNYNWRTETNQPTVRVFDRMGLEKPGTFTINQEPGLFQIQLTLDNWNEVAVIE